MSTVDSLKRIIRDALHLGERANALTASSPLMGAIAEFDSMAVVTVLTMIEDEFGFSISDDEVSGRRLRDARHARRVRRRQGRQLSRGELSAAVHCRQPRTIAGVLRQPSRTACSGVLIVPPFAEEMNKSRHLFTEVADGAHRVGRRHRRGRSVRHRRQRR